MSPQYLSPGVYVEEVDRGSKPIQAAGTSVAAFVGFTERRPEGNNGEPVLVTSWSQYQESFGGFVRGAFLPISVYGYFLNGGGICFIQSVATADQLGGDSGGSKTLALPGKTVAQALEVESKVEGTVSISVEDPAAGSADDVFKLTVKGPGDVTETFDNVTFNKGRGVRNVVDVVNKESKLVKLKELDASAPAADRRPKTGSYEIVVAASSSTALAVTSQTFQGDISLRTGISGLEVAEEATMVIVPDLMTSYLNGSLKREDVIAVQNAVIAHCELMKDRVAILDPLPDLSPQEVNDWRMKEANFSSSYAALYYPWIWVANPLAGNGQPGMIKVPPSGHVAGLYARVDNERGVHKAPANEILRGAVKMERGVTKGEQDILNPNGINCIRTFPGRGIRVWGARTLDLANPSWRYINVRRLFCMVEESIREGTMWAVFEPNDMNLWERMKRDISSFLTIQWRNGALFGATAAEAFFVICDETLNSQEIRDAGMVICEIGISPVKPAEFVIFRIGQSA